ncbi:3'(2'),5'-bisphosphate nucleotidase CysQ [Afifella sp. IM 167]|uniref:3'(2'),5'-bisphosphate nucleotidase CysQ n=1 Tax=Afifella sp. IM 167 TaxID=2033586 RepID=UPI001CCB73FE|nr:3'(2'),5'-bisphosphate nucleotidase CysQ [Afifella sp. IM 167]MBZ8132957.1 3'(2'),5'-bisphosphate nucleotidase [Afifella sp. IM 167]
MSLSHLPPLLQPLVEASLAAGRAILKSYDAGLSVETKADESPVTEADRASEKVIDTFLREAFPDIPVVAEEACAAHGPPETGDRFFLVDPLDGTKEYITGSGEFTVNIALIEDGHPVAGVVFAPALGTLYCGAGGKAFSAEADARTGTVGAFLPIHVRAAQEPPVAVASRSHLSPETAVFLDRCGCIDSRSIGSSLKFCLVAEGEADFYPRLGPTMQWDTAAGQAVLQAAGGKVVKLDGTPFLYGRPNEGGPRPFENPFFLALGDASLAGTLIEAPAA